MTQVNKVLLKQNVEKLAEEQNKTVLEIITTLQDVAAKTQPDETLLNTLCEIKWDYIPNSLQNLKERQALTEDNTTITLVKKAEKMGEYKPTLIDERKKQVDFLLKSICGGKYTIKVQNSEIKLGKRGVTNYGNDYYLVTSTVLKNLQKQYSFMTDF